MVLQITPNKFWKPAASKDSVTDKQHMISLQKPPTVYILPDEILINPEKNCNFSRVLSENSVINLTHLASSILMNTLHLGASNSFDKLI